MSFLLTAMPCSTRMHVLCALSSEPNSASCRLGARRIAEQLNMAATLCRRMNAFFQSTTSHQAFFLQNLIVRLLGFSHLTFVLILLCIFEGISTSDGTTLLSFK